MKKTQKILRIFAITAFFIAVISTVLIHLNNKKIVEIHFVDIKNICLGAIILCILVLIEEFLQIIFVGVGVIKKGYHNIKCCDDELFAEIDKHMYCYKESNLYYINLIRIINLYYREEGPIDKLAKEKQIERLFLRNDFLHKQKNLHEELSTLFNSFAISLIVGLLGGSLTDDNAFITLVVALVMASSFFVIFFIKYVYRGQGGICLNQIYEYEIAKLEEKISNLQKTFIISNEDEKYINTQQVALKELVKKKNKDRKYKKDTTIIEDIYDLSNVDLCIIEDNNIYDKKLHINNQEVYFAYKKSEDCCLESTFANGGFEKVYNILSKYELIDLSENICTQIEEE